MGLGSDGDVSKNYAAGLEMCRPGGACFREIPSADDAVGCVPELSPIGLVPKNGKTGGKKPDWGQPMVRSESPVTVGRHALLPIRSYFPCGSGFLLADHPVWLRFLLRPCGS